MKWVVVLLVLYGQFVSFSSKREFKSFEECEKARPEMVVEAEAYFKEHYPEATIVSSACEQKGE